MKITLVTETYPPEVNGVAMTLSHLVAGLAEREHELSVVRPRQVHDAAPRADRARQEELFSGVPIPGYPLLRLGLPAHRRLRELWTARRPDLVHIATEGPLGWSALRVARRLGLPVTSSFHTNFHTYSKHYGFGFLQPTAVGYLRWFHNCTRRTFVPTEELRRELAQLGFNRLALLSRGVDTSLFSPALRSVELRRDLGVEPDAPLVLHAGRMATEKNYRLLFRAYAAMREANPRCRFVLIGEGPLRESLGREHGYARFLPFLPRQELARHYAAADIYIHASLSETFGNVLTEALASGLAVAGFNYAAARQFVRNEENGLVVPRDEPEALIDAAVRLATDTTLRERLGRGARASVEAHSWKKIIEGFEADLTDVARAMHSS